MPPRFFPAQEMENSQALQSVWLAVQSLVLPAVILLAGLFALRRVLSPAAALAVAACAGVIAGWAALFGPQAQFPPRQTLDWLPLLIVAAAAALAASRRLPGWRREAVALAVIAAGLYLLSPPLLREQPAATLAFEWLGALVLAAGLLAAGRVDGERAAAALAAAFGSLGFVTSLGGSLIIGGIANAAFALAACIYLGTAAGRLARPGPALVSGALTLWLWLAFSARHLAEIRLTETLLSAAAAAAALVASRLGAGGRMRVAVALLPPAAPALLAVGLASWRYLAAQSMGY